MKDFNKRQNLFRQLMKAWMTEHRPDVEAAIWVEVDKRFPRGKKLWTKTVLPDSLAKLK